MKLDAKTTALVLVDLQKGILALPVKPHSAADVYDKSMRLAARFRETKSPVIRVRVSFAPDFADAPPSRVDQPNATGALPPGWDDFPEPVDATDIVVTKHQWGAFYGTDLDLQLRRRGVRSIVLGGIATTIGVESTARSAWEHGYDLVVCEDLCSDLIADAHASSVKYIFPRLARLAASETIRLE